LKESAKNTTQKDKSTFIVVARREDQPTTSSGIDIFENETGSVSGIPVTADSGKKRFLLLKGKDRGVSNIPEGLLQQQGVTSPAGNSPASTAPKETQRREAGGRLIRSILINNEARQSQSSTAVQPQQKIQILNSESGKRPPRNVNARLGLNGLVSKNEPNSFGSEGNTKRTADDKFTKKDFQGLGNVNEKQEKRTRNRDRPDRGVWTPLRRSDVSHASDENLSSSVLHPTQSQCDSFEGTATHGFWSAVKN
jgi:regulator of nonsense transcripts 3